MGKIKIKKSELDRIIKEETLKFKQAIVLKEELKKINGELKQLNEVEAGADEAPTGGDNLTAAETQFVKNLASQKAPKFSTKNGNPNLKMEDDVEGDIEDTDLDTDMDLDTDSESINKADVLKAIEDLKMALNLHGGDESEESEEIENDELEANGEEVGDDDEEFEFDGGEEGSEDVEGGEDVEDSEVEDIEEGGYKESHQDPAIGEVVTTEEDVNENLEEPIEGKTPVQAAKQDDVNDNMEKVNTLMEAERKRMAILAGIMKG